MKLLDISKILVDCQNPIPVPQNQTLEIPSISLDPKDPKHGMQCLPEALKGFPGRRSQWNSFCTQDLIANIENTFICLHVGTTMFLCCANLVCERCKSNQHMLVPALLSTLCSRTPQEEWSHSSCLFQMSPMMLSKAYKSHKSVKHWTKKTQYNLK